MEQDKQKQNHYAFLNFIYFGIIIFGVIMFLASFSGGESSIGASIGLASSIFFGGLLAVIQVIALSVMYFKNKYLDMKNKIILISAILVLIILIFYIIAKLMFNINQ